MRAMRCLLVACVGLASCGESDTLDVAKLEGEITPEIEEQTGTPEVTVDCPDEDVEIEEGTEFECDLAAPGGIEAKVRVTQTDDEGNVRWEVVRP